MNKEQTNVYHFAKDVVRYAYIDKYEMKDFVLAFFLSEHFLTIINYYDIIYYSPYNIYRYIVQKYDVKKNEDGKEYNLVVINYICYIYLAFCFKTYESFKLIIKMLPFDDIINYYEQYHTLPDERVIFKAKINYNLKMNAVRKNRATNYKFDLSNNKKNLFIAKHIYLKLFNYPSIQNLKYEYSDRTMYLKSNISTLFAIDYTHLKDIMSDGKISFLKYNHPNNILMVFLKDEEEISQKDLEKLFYNQAHIPFDQILIYKNEEVLFINQADGYKKFYIFITSLDIKKIEKDYKNI